ncbi:MAG: KEOPS complex kinase/ATPase Bud32 [Candidatus Methanofastidiosia archaeon]
MKLISKCAEANLYLADFHEVYFEWRKERVLIKHRIPKGYRHERLCRKLRERRTIHEARLLHDAKKYVKTPAIYEIDKKNSKLFMEYIPGVRVKECISTKVCERIGEEIAKLHKGGIIHGDLTTSNMILKDYIYFIDFGLGEFSFEVEKQAVDLHLLKQILKSTHYERNYFEYVKKGYLRQGGKEEVFERIGEIERRGRYVER